MGRKEPGNEATLYHTHTRPRVTSAMARLRGNPNVMRFVVEARATGRQLGTGSYGSVEEVCLCSHSVSALMQG